MPRNPFGNFLEAKNTSYLNSNRKGGNGGALAIGVADKLAMMRYSVFAVNLQRVVVQFYGMTHQK